MVGRLTAGTTSKATGSFSSGSNACEWIILGTPIFDGDGPPLKSLWCLVERPNWEVVDTWYAAGLKGSASNDINVNGLFVLEAFTLNMAVCDGRPGVVIDVQARERSRRPLRCAPVLQAPLDELVTSRGRDRLQPYVTDDGRPHTSAWHLPGGSAVASCDHTRDTGVH